PLVECKKCKTIFRADKIVEEFTGKPVPEGLSEKNFDELIAKNKVVCTSCKSYLGNARKFNMMFIFGAGPRNDEKIGLRPETCQTIFIDFPRLYSTMRIKLPIGVAQAGKAFRNEISPRQGLIRTREFTQAEIEVFINPKKDFVKFEDIRKYKLKLLILGKKDVSDVTAEEAINKKVISEKFVAYYLALLQQFYEACGMKEVRFRQVGSDERAFYSKETWDCEVNTSLGWIEVCACNYRGDYDLTQHGKGSSKDLSVMDETERVLPHVFELSMGVDRSVYALVEQAYHEEQVEGEKRIVLKLNKKIAPVFCAVFPLVSKDGIPEKAEEVFNQLKNCFDAVYDEPGSIGKRYRRMDEVGCPYCITIDYDSLKGDDVTVRDRDSMKQERIKIKDLQNFLYNKFIK
ncbi:MAG: glycine--tRNA ligase, partial [archaeon]